jgi:hypothetical protein
MPVPTVCYGVLRILSVLLFLPRSGQAQEGGTFCVGPSYLAYELVVQETYDSAHGVTPARHSLYLVWPDSTGFMGRHRLAPPTYLRCPRNAVSRGAGAPLRMGFPVYRSGYCLAHRRAQLRGGTLGWAGTSRPGLPDFPDSTLWHGWDPQAADTVRVPLTAGAASWALIVTAHETAPGRCEYQVETRLVRFATPLRPRAAAVLYKQVRHGECGEWPLPNYRMKRDGLGRRVSQGRHRRPSSRSFARARLGPQLMRGG